jgi:hypothetical protein
MAVNVFSVPVFFIVFRETLEVSIIVAVLLAFLKQTLSGPNRDVAVYRRLVRQVCPIVKITYFNGNLTDTLGLDGRSHRGAN